MCDGLGACDGDGQAPVVLLVTPAELATDVRPDTAVTLSFSEPMNRQSVEGVFTLTPVVTGTFVWSQGDSVVRYVPDIALSPHTAYVVALAASASDLAGNALGDDLTVAFSTGVPVDHQPPWVVWRSPEPDSTDLSTDVAIVMIFSEPMDTLRTAIVLIPSAPGSLVWSASDTVATLTPSDPLAYGTSYVVYATGSDVEGNRLTPDFFDFITRSLQ